jgi:hypothetical protein
VTVQRATPTANVSLSIAHVKIDIVGKDGMSWSSRNDVTYLACIYASGAQIKFKNPKTHYTKLSYFKTSTKVLGKHKTLWHF